MSRPPFEVADVIRKAGDSFRQRTSLTWPQRKVLAAIARCRTAALGGHRDQCMRCGHQAISYNSCRNRHCPKCQTNAREKWLAKRQQELLPASYFHLVFSVPHALVPLMWQNQRRLFSLLFESSAATLLEVAADPKHLGVEIGFLAILHTWGQTLQSHPHIHCVVPGGGLSFDHRRWLSSRSSFFLPVTVLSRVFRGKFGAGRDCGVLFATTNSYSTVSAGHSQSRRTSSPFCALCFNRTGSSMPSPPSADQNTSFTTWPATLTASPSPTTGCSRSPTPR